MQRPLNFFSTCTVPLEILDGSNSVIGNATGFFYNNKNNELFLITNWHVVTGRDHFNKSISNSAVPTVLKFKILQKFIHESSSLAVISHKVMSGLEVDLNSQDGNRPEWLEHSEYRDEVDVVAIKIENEEMKEKCHFFSVNKYQGFDSFYEGEPMDDIYVIGYPWGIKYAGTLPLYKRGSIASETQVNFSELPKFLIDCRTSPSMSGSPVIGSKSGLWHKDGAFDESGRIRGDTSLNGVQNFLGVYSGRLKCSDSLNEISEIGVVWKASLIDDIVNKGITGTTLDSMLENL